MPTVAASGTKILRPSQLTRVEAAPGAPKQSSYVLLVPGAGPGGWYYSGMQQLLAKEGYMSICLEWEHAKCNRRLGWLCRQIYDAIQSTPESSPILLGHSVGALATHAYAVAHREWSNEMQPPEKQIKGLVLWSPSPTRGSN